MVRSSLVSSSTGSIAAGSPYSTSSSGGTTTPRVRRAAAGPQLRWEQFRPHSPQDAPPTSPADARTLCITEPVATWEADFVAPAGWYEIRLALRSQDRYQIRKRLEVIVDRGGPAGTPAIHREVFAWNQSFAERFVIRLREPSRRVRLILRHAEGVQHLDALEIRSLGRPQLIREAILTKIQLTWSYRCFGAALRRGGQLLYRGKFREFYGKLFKGLSDRRAMQLGTVEQNEVNHSWWRRHSLSAEDAQRIQELVDAMPAPPPVTVILPVQMKQLDPARLSAHSVRRQIYPHWQLVLLAVAPPEEVIHLERLLGSDPRVRWVVVPPREGLELAFTKAMQSLETPQAMLLPAGIELAEHALYHLVAARMAQPQALAIAGTVALPFGQPDQEPREKVWLRPPAQLLEPLPLDSESWVLPEDLAYPIDERPAWLRQRAKATPSATSNPAPAVAQSLWFGADLRGVGGYDHVTFAFLKGLALAGVELQRHPIACIRPDLVPPALMPKLAPRTPRDLQLVVGPPFLVPRFGLDRCSAVYTMWETDQLDPRWIESLQRAGLIIVPSAWQKTCFEADGLTVPIEVAPLGFDPLIYHARPGRPQVTTFGTAGALSAGGVRKNAQWVIEQFRKAFPTETDVRLRVKITPNSPSVETYDDPRIDVLRAVLPLTELADWYRSLTAYVNASFGEGFGLHLIEAMACGRTLVTPEYSGLTAFFTSPLGYPVAYNRVEAHNEIYQGHWAEPVAGSFQNQLRAIYDDPEQAYTRGLACAAAAKAFTWKHAGRQLQNALARHGFLPRITRAETSEAL